MNTAAFLKLAAAAAPRRALPIVSFPGANRQGIPVDALLKDPALYAGTIRYVAEHTPALAAVCPMDLSVEAEAFGASVRFRPEEVPAVVGALLSDPEDAGTLQIPAPDSGRLNVCLEGIRLYQQHCGEKPLFSGMIGPFSLAGRLMDVTEILYLCYDEPEAVHTVLHTVTEFLAAYGAAMKAAGADGLILAEPLAGVMSPELAAAFSVPYVKQILATLQDDSFAVIYHNCGNSVPQMLPDIFALGAAGYHFGNAVNMADILRRAPSDAICMGNLDPTELFVHGTPESVSAATRELMRTCGGYANFIPSSGCDLPYHAPWENILAFYDAL